MSIYSTINALPNSAVTALKQGQLAAQSNINAVNLTDVNNMIKNVVNEWLMESFDVDAVARLFGYDGFDPKEIYKSLIASMTEASLTEDELNEDIGMLLVLQHEKGNVNASNFKSLKPEGQHAVNLLFKRYHIYIKASANRKRTVTLPRLAACFPLQMSIISFNNPKDYAGPYDSKELPHFMKTSSFPSLIPIGEKASSFLVASYNAYATDAHIALQKINYTSIDEAAKKRYYSDQLKFTDIGFQSSLMSTEGRRRAMTLLGMGKHYKSIKQVFDRIGLDASASCTEVEWNDAISKWKLAGVTEL